MGLYHIFHFWPLNFRFIHGIRGEPRKYNQPLRPVGPALLTEGFFLYNTLRVCRKEPGSLTLAIKENRCEASKMAYFFVKFFIFFLSNV